MKKSILFGIIAPITMLVSSFTAYRWGKTGTDELYLDLSSSHHVFNGSKFMFTDPTIKSIHFGGTVDTLYETEYLVEAQLNKKDTGYMELGIGRYANLTLVKRIHNDSLDQLKTYIAISGIMHVLRRDTLNQRIEAQFNGIVYDYQAQDSLEITDGYFKYGY